MVCYDSFVLVTTVLDAPTAFQLGVVGDPLA